MTASSSERRNAGSIAPQCWRCNRFVKVSDPGTRKYVERGDYGSILSVEFGCARCEAERKRQAA